MVKRWINDPTYSPFNYMDNRCFLFRVCREGIEGMMGVGPFTIYEYKEWRRRVIRHITNNWWKTAKELAEELNISSASASKYKKIVLKSKYWWKK